MSEVAHQPQPEPPDPHAISPARLRAQQRYIALHGDPELTPLDLLVEESLADFTEERISQEREEVQEKLRDAWGEFLYGNRLCMRNHEEVTVALERYQRELDGGKFPESRILQISLLQTLLKGGSVGVWSLEPLIAEARKDERSLLFTDEELAECFEKSMDLFAQRHWIETAHPQNGPHAGAEDLA